MDQNGDRCGRVMGSTGLWRVYFQMFCSLVVHRIIRVAKYFFTDCRCFVTAVDTVYASLVGFENICNCKKLIDWTSSAAHLVTEFEDCTNY